MKKGISGIGVLIIFVAMILVAAVVAMVLLQSVGSLEAQALQTGREAGAQISNKLMIVSVSGRTDSGTSPTEIQTIRIIAKLAPGSSAIKLNDTVINILAGNMQLSGLTYNTTLENTEANASATATDGYYSALFLGKPSDYSAANKQTVTGTEMVEFWVDLGASTIGTSTQVKISILPQSGVPETKEMSTPTAFSGLYESLYP